MDNHSDGVYNIVQLAAVDLAG